MAQGNIKGDGYSLVASATTNTNDNVVVMQNVFSNNYRDLIAHIGLVGSVAYLGQTYVIPIDKSSGVTITCPVYDDSGIIQGVCYLFLNSSGLLRIHKSSGTQALQCDLYGSVK